MTVLRNRMDEAMVLRGFSPRTREAYLACVRALAEHYRKPPDGLDGSRIQAYLLHLISEKKLAYAQRKSPWGTPALIRQPVLSLSVLLGSAQARDALGHPDGQGAQASAADPFAR